MSADAFEAGFESRIADLYATDAQFAAAAPVDALSAATDQLSLSLPRLMRIVMEGYAERPALGQRAVDYVSDPATGRTTAELLPRFETVTYGEVWKRYRRDRGCLVKRWGKGRRPRRYFGLQ